MKSIGQAREMDSTKWLIILIQWHSLIQSQFVAHSQKKLMQKEKLIYFDSIDFFRALGVFFVFLHHAIQVYGFAQNTYLGPYLYYSTAFMWSGVNLFFLASGFINGRNLFSDISTVDNG